MELAEVIFSLLVIALGVLPMLAIRRLEEGELKTWALVSWLAHVLAGIGQILMYQYYYHYGDALAYAYFAAPISDAMGRDLSNLLPEVLRLFLQREQHLPFEINGEGSTGSMQAVTVLLFFLLGNSIYASSVAVAMASFVGKYLVYRALRPFVPETSRFGVFLAVMVTPSFVFWTSTILKEPITWVFLAPGFVGLCGLVQFKSLTRNIVLIAASMALTALIKPYISMIFVVAGAAWLAWSRTVRAGSGLVARPVTLLVAVVILVFGLTLSQRLFPKLNTSNLGESVSEKRRVMDKGGSGYDLGPGDEEDGNTSMARQLALAPVALVTAFYRPFIFEARNPVQFLNALETTALLVLTIQLLRRMGLARMTQLVLSQPLLVFCVLFVVALSLGTSLSTSNLGTLSRYRAPMVPFLVVLLLRLRAGDPERDPSVPALVDQHATV